MGASSTRSGRFSRCAGAREGRAGARGRRFTRRHVVLMCSARPAAAPRPRHRPREEARGAAICVRLRAAWRWPASRCCPPRCPAAERTRRSAPSRVGCRWTWRCCHHVKPVLGACQSLQAKLESLAGIALPRGASSFKSKAGRQPVGAPHVLAAARDASVYFPGQSRCALRGRLGQRAAAARSRRGGADESGAILHSLDAQCIKDVHVCRRLSASGRRRRGWQRRKRHVAHRPERRDGSLCASVCFGRDHHAVNLIRRRRGSWRAGCGCRCMRRCSLRHDGVSSGSYGLSPLPRQRQHRAAPPRAAPR